MPDRQTTAYTYVDDRLVLLVRGDMQAWGNSIVDRRIELHLCLLHLLLWIRQAKLELLYKQSQARPRSSLLYWLDSA